MRRIIKHTAEIAPMQSPDQRPDVDRHALRNKEEDFERCACSLQGTGRNYSEGKSMRFEPTFAITKEMLKAKGMRPEGYERFIKRHPDGVDYQALLNDYARQGWDDDANWLMDAFGNTNTTLEAEEINCSCSLFFAGRIRAARSIFVKKRLRAGWSIEAGCGIRAGSDIKAGESIGAGCGIKAGWSIEANYSIKAGYGIKAGHGIKAGCGIKSGWGIRAGEGIEAGWGVETGWGIEAGKGIKVGYDWGIYTGLCVRISNKKEIAVIRAEERPNNIVCGEFMKVQK